MKKSLLLLFFSLSFTQIIAQSSVILPNGNVIPSFTLANRPATNQTLGQLIYQIDGTSGLYVWSGTTWTAVLAGSSGSGTVTNVTASAPISVVNGTTTPALSISQANSTTNGFLSSTDWSIFSNKQNTLSSANATTNGILTSADWNTFSNKFSYPNIANGSVLFSTGTNLTGSASKMFWDDATGRLNVFGYNNGSGSANWISGNFGGNAGNRVVLGTFNGDASIGAHTSDLSAWAGLSLNPGGGVIIPSLAGTSTQMVVVGSNGFLGSQAIPANGGTVTNITTTAPLTVTSSSNTPVLGITQASATIGGFLTSVDWNIFNNKQNALSNANINTNGILTSADWNIFNNKQNALNNANASTNGILTSADWNTFNNKFSLPSLTSGSVLFSNGTAISENNSSFKWDNSIRRLDIKGLNDGTPSAGFSNWISTSVGGSGGNRVVLGVQNGEATIGAHTNALTNWAKLIINPAGATAVGSLTGIGTRMVITNADGELSSMAIPTSADNLGNHTASQNLNLATSKLVGNGGSSGISIANNGTINIDAALTVGGATTLSSTLNVTGQSTFSNLAGIGNRMVVSDANGILNTQAIPVGGDNLGNHVASQTLNLNSNWISNNGLNKGIRIDNNGQVGINVTTPGGTFDVGKAVAVYSGTFSNNLTPNSSVYSFSTGTGSSPSYISDNNSGTQWRGNSNINNQVVGLDFGVNNIKIIRKYEVIFNTSTSHNILANFNFQASHNGSTWVTLDTKSCDIKGTGSFKNCDETFSISNTTAYQHYRIIFISFESYGFGSGNTALTPFLNELLVFEENTNVNYTSGALIVSNTNNVGIGTDAPTANLDVVGSIRLRNGAAAGSVLVSDAIGNATWSSSPSITSATVTNLGIGTAFTTANSLTTSGIGGVKVSSTNAGTGTNDWVAINAGGTIGDRVVSGVLNGKATIGGHTNTLSGWTDLVISPTSANTVTIGSDANVSPLETVVTTVNSPSPIAGGHNRNLIVNGSVRQAYYMAAVSIPANTTQLITWTHNFGYSPIVMMSTDENGQGGGGNMEFCSYTEYNNSLNQMVFKIRNLGGATANGNFRWIVVN